MSRTLPFVVALTLGCSACRHTQTYSHQVPTSFGETASLGRAHPKFLTVDWPGSERAALESVSSRGLVVVRFDGSQLDLLPRCWFPAAYDYSPVTIQTDRVRIVNDVQLHAQLPAGAARLGAKLAVAGQLNADMLVVGRRENHRSTYPASALDGDCAEATHVLAGLTVGAFVLYTGRERNVWADVKLGTVQSGFSANGDWELLNMAGASEACLRASPKDEDPPATCASVMRIELVELKFDPPEEVQVDIADKPEKGTEKCAPADVACLKAEARTLLRQGGISFGVAALGGAIFAPIALYVSEEGWFPLSLTLGIISGGAAALGTLGGIVLLSWGGHKMRKAKRIERALHARPFMVPSTAGVVLGISGKF